MTIRRVLVAVDFSTTSLGALDYAIEFAKPFSPELLVLFVVEPFSYAAAEGLYAGGTVLATLLEEQRRAAREQLDRLEADLKKRRVSVRTLLETGTPYQVIVDVAKKLKPDLVVVGTHGRTGLSHLLIGSVAERVVRNAPCPVLTVQAAPAKRKRVVSAGRRRGKEQPARKRAAKKPATKTGAARARRPR